VLRANENADLLISLFVNNTDPKISSVFQIVDHLNTKYERRAITTIKLYGEFSRGVAIDKAMQSSVIKDHDIIFAIDVDIFFRPLTLQRVRQNTLRGRQVYLPIVFSEYNPELVGQSEESTATTSSQRHSIPFQSSSLAFSSLALDSDGNFMSDYRKMSVNYQFYVNSSVSNDNGYFREFGYGIASFYKCDIMNNKINGFVTDVKGWGMEDVKFLDKIIAVSYQIQNQLLLYIAEGKLETELKNISSINLEVFRAAEPSLVHVFHPISCDRNLEKSQFNMCLGTKSSTLGNYKLLKDKHFVRRDFKQLVDQVRNEVVAH